MIKNFTYLLLGILMMPIVAFSQEEESGPAKREEWQRRIIQDPQTGLVPLQELENGRNQVMQFYKNAKKSKTEAAIPNVNWKERGPNNVGGRTRAIMWDPKNGSFTPKKKKVWAGGVAGGLWYNNDITDANSSWIKVDDFWDNIAITWIAYDPSDVNKNTLYVATGERSASGKGSNTGSSGTGGGGIWKSIDGGTNWSRLTSTIPDYTLTLGATTGGATNEADSIKVGWREIYKVLVTSTGTVLALTKGGILKSEDKGTTWNRLKGTNAPATFAGGYQFTSVSDMELGQDNVLYVAEGTPYHSPRILKSTDGTYANYQICPLPGSSYENGRVEIALATGTQGANQVVYAVSAANGAPIYRFFLKSTNAGGTWTNMTPSTIKDNEAIFGKQGDWGLILGTHNTKPDALYFGGTSFDVSTNGGTSWNEFVKNSPWSPISDVMHADHHAFMANPENNDEAIFGNDGGVYYSNNWSAPSTTLTALNIQKRNKDYNVTQYFGVDLHPTANNGLVVGGTQDNGTHAISSAYNTVGSGLSINGGDGALTFIDQIDPRIVISSYVQISPEIHKNGAVNVREDLLPHRSSKGQFINPADYDSPAHTYYANVTFDREPPFTTATDTLAFRYKITPSDLSAEKAYTSYTHSSLTYAVSETNPPIKVSFLKLGKVSNATSNRVMYIGTSDGDVYKTSAFGVDGNQSVTFTKIMDKATTGTGNVASIDFGADENTIIVIKSNYNIKSVFYAINANAGTGTTWVSKDEATHGLPNIPIRYALINPKDTKQVLLATELGVWSTTDITAANPDWKETNASLARVRCDMLKYRASDETVIVGTNGRGIFSVSLNIPCTPPIFAMASSNSPVTVGSPINLTSSSTGGTSQVWAGPNSYTTTAQNPVIASATAAMGGVYTVTITSSGTCTATATTNVVVNTSTVTPPPTADNPQRFCSTTSPTLANLVATGTDLRWYATSSGGTPLATTTALVNNTDYYVSQTVGGTESLRATVRAFLLPPPFGLSVSSNSPVASGTTINLSLLYTSGVNYINWTGPNSFTSDQQYPTIPNATAANAGVYTARVRSVLATDVCFLTATTNVVINAPVPCTPVTGATAGSNSPVNVGNALRLTSSSTGGTSQAWAGPNGFTSTSQNLSVGPVTTAMAGVYTVTITSSGTCTATATTSVVVVMPVPTSSVVFVNIANTNATQNGIAWATAYSNLQTALSSAPANSTFWVAKGVYKPTTTTNRNISFNIPSGAKVYGGFVGTETMLNERNVEGNPTILSGEIGSSSTVKDNSYHVVTFTGANNSTVLDGFTVMGGNASFNSTSPPSLSNSSASQPLSIYDGGGIGLDNGSSPTIINCRIISNDAIQGGGLYATNNSNPMVKNSVFMNNQATFGGGIYNLRSSPTYSNILIAGNKATGGGMYNNGSNPIITNVTIAGNGGYNGAIFNSNSAPIVKNSILWGNISPFNDTQSVTTYSIVEGGYVGVGNLNVNPQFVNLIPYGLSPSLSGDYKLTNTSPAIDAGDNGMVGMTDTDLGNFPRRFNSGIVDIGAYEFQGSRMGGTVTSIVSGNWEQGTTWNIGRKPLAGDTVIINNNHIVTVNNDGVMKNIEIRPNATLLYKTSGIKLQIGF